MTVQNKNLFADRTLDFRSPREKQLAYLKENKKDILERESEKEKRKRTFENKMHKRNHIFYRFDRACTWNCIKYKNIVRSITDYIYSI